MFSTLRVCTQDSRHGENDRGGRREVVDGSIVDNRQHRFPALISDGVEALISDGVTLTPDMGT